MKTALDYTLDLETELNDMDGISEGHYSRATLSHQRTYGAQDGEPRISINGSRIIERHIQRVIDDCRNSTPQPRQT